MLHGDTANSGYFHEQKFIVQFTGSNSKRRRLGTQSHDPIVPGFRKQHHYCLMKGWYYSRIDRCRCRRCETTTEKESRSTVDKEVNRLEGARELPKQPTDKDLERPPQSSQTSRRLSEDKESSVCIGERGEEVFRICNRRNLFCCCDESDCGWSS